MRCELPSLRSLRQHRPYGLAELPRVFFLHSLKKSDHAATEILGVPISTVDMDRAAHQVFDWVHHREGRYVCTVDVNSLMLARRKRSHRAARSDAGMAMPDGAPLSWFGSNRKDAQR